jgi:hypothetical protein
LTTQYEISESEYTRAFQSPEKLSPDFSPEKKFSVLGTMKSAFYFAIILSAAAAASAQNSDNGSEKRVVITNDLPPATKIVPKATPTPKQILVINGDSENADEVGTRDRIVIGSAPKQPDVQQPKAEAKETRTASTGELSFRHIKELLAEAKREMSGRPDLIASTNGPEEGVLVRVAFYDKKHDRVDYVVLPKTLFLSTKEDKFLTSQSGVHLRARTIRGNGVNTPITLTDDEGTNHVPLMVQYPVIRGGKYFETAYYISTHPGLVTPEVVNAGRFYVHNVIEIAREKLRASGVFVQPKVADIAERLATVEHVDHYRFRTEYHPNIYNDIFTLFALNEGGTYRYSVSSAGAGGMVQMIPSTYRMVRAKYPQAGLDPRFVEGMQDHVNAAKAMLLYMQWTWNDLLARPTISDALASGIATQEQLMAAGYNSNPARLSGYISRAGENWTNLIPRETKIYLQIFESVEKNVPMTPRTR